MVDISCAGKTEANKDKEDARRVINDQKRRIAQLESSLAQKAKEYDLSLASEATRHRDEIKDLLCRNNSSNHLGGGSANNLNMLTARSTSFNNLNTATTQPNSSKKTSATEQVWRPRRKMSLMLVMAS